MSKQPKSFIGKLPDLPAHLPVNREAVVCKDPPQKDPIQPDPINVNPWICSYTLKGESTEAVQSLPVPVARSCREASDTFWRAVDFSGNCSDMITSLTIHQEEQGIS